MFLGNHGKTFAESHSRSGEVRESRNRRLITGGKRSENQRQLSASSSILEEEGETVERQQQAEILRSYRNPVSNCKAPERQALSKINS